MPYKDIKSRRKTQAISFRKRKARARKELLLILGNRCSHCKYDKDERALCIDHIKGGGRKEQKKYGGSYLFAILKKVRNGSKEYQILCCNCNAIKKENNKENRNYKYN